MNFIENSTYFSFSLASDKKQIAFIIDKFTPRNLFEEMFLLTQFVYIIRAWFPPCMSCKTPL